MGINTETKQPIRIYLLDTFKSDDSDSYDLKSSVDAIKINDAASVHTSLSIQLQNNYDINRYAGLVALDWVWHNINEPYIGISFDRDVESIRCDKMEQYMLKNVAIVTSDYRELDSSIKNEYRTRYYGYDLEVMRQQLINNNQTISEFAEEVFLDGNRFVAPTVVMRKDVFRKFCLWLFSILGECNKYIKKKRSNMQNKALVHLTHILLPLYIEYNRKRLSIENDLIIEKKDVKPEITFKELLSLKDEVIDMVKRGEVEDAIDLCKLHPEDSDYAQINWVFDNYNRQRFHFEVTDLDKAENIEELFLHKKNNSCIRNNSKTVLFIGWNAINNWDYINGLKKLGFEVEIMDAGKIYSLKPADSLDKILNFFDDKDFCFVFTINYFDFVSEACYIHGIPYIAWAYDSPINISDLKKADHNTTHIFLFDSSEVENYRKRGLNNVHYVPLAVDISKYDNISCSAEDIKKYKAQVSFVGRLYENHLNEYLNYLTDYKKAFFNAVVDYNVGLYDSYGVEDAFASIGFDEKSEKAFFNAVLKGERKDPMSPIYDLSEVFSRVGLLTQQTITNRERLILISVLSNHWDFKLYSSSTHEVFKTTTECGIVNYDTEMPKVFKCSDINLNVTLKTIKTGIPLRCLDIMGCGGFLLTSYQRDMDNDFVDGESIAFFRSLDEAYDKCKYYIEHETERKTVARKGYEIIRSKYSYDEQFRRILRIAGLEKTIG